jgi:hypothetical protein
MRSPFVTISPQNKYSVRICFCESFFFWGGGDRERIEYGYIAGPSDMLDRYKSELAEATTAEAWTLL